jgi:cysteinyl-tRNA synthetase
MYRYLSSAFVAITLFTGCGNLPDLDFRQEMVDFVLDISIYAKEQNPDFHIFPQNASELWVVSGYLAGVDGIGQEDIYYGYDSDGVKTPTDVTSELEDNLAEFVNAGKVVITTDYVFDDPNTPSFSSDALARIEDAYSQSRANDFVPYCAVRELSHLTINPGHEPAPNSSPVTLDSVQDFIYILQHSEELSRSVFLDSLASLGFDLIVMDYEDDGGAYTSAEISTLKQKSGAILLAYMSIGEAEDYRFYWQKDWSSKRNRPDWIEGENPDWKGNYLVRYWEDAWQQIIFGTDSSYLDAIISQGFDGVYLDKIDSYEDYL